MKVKSKINNNEYESLHNLRSELTKDVTYEVFGIFFPEDRSIKDPVYFPEGAQFDDCYVCILDKTLPSMENDDLAGYPVWLPLKEFEVIDTNIRPGWALGFWDDIISGKIISFPEFASNASDFYSNLVDGQEKETQIFTNYFRRYTSFEE